MTKPQLIILGLVLTTQYLAACAGTPKLSFSALDQANTTNPTNTNPVDPDGPICDPNQTPPTPQNGVFGRIGLLADDVDLSNLTVSSFFGDSEPGGEATPNLNLSTQLFYSSINVPERAFTEGFLYQNGQPLLDPRDTSGQTALIEYFGLKFEGKLKLNGAAPGKYYLGLIADDGAIVDVKENGQWRRIVDNDGIHSQRFGCSLPNDFIELNDDETEVPIRVLYFQGPRYHISLMLLWKRIEGSASTGAIDPLCGAGGNDFFHDSRVSPSIPTQAYLEIQQRQWAVIPATSLFLNGGQTNPCE